MRMRRQRASRPSIDRLPPHDNECEQSVIGCALLSPNECMDECISKMGRPGKEVFYDLRHQTIYDSLLEMHTAHIPIDVITLQSRLKDKQLLDQVGGIVYLAQLQDKVPSAANLSYYLDHVVEKYILRKTIHTCTDVVGQIYDWEGDVDGLMDRVERDVLAIRESVVKNLEMADIAQVQQTVISQYEAAFTGQKHVGIQTGYPDLDRLIGGMMPQEMIGLGAVPSMGKTSLALNIIHKLAIQQKVPIGFFSLDDSVETIIHRLACIDAQVNGHAIRCGTVTADDMEKLSQAMIAINTSKHCLFIDDHVLDEGEMMAKGRRMVASGAKIIFLDYLQLKKAKGDGMYERTTNASHATKNMAKELGVPVLVISAITKPHDATKNWRPTLFDFRGSGDIDYDLNQAWLLYRDPEDENEYAPEFKVYLDVAKNKQGPTGRVELVFRKFCTRFESMSNLPSEPLPVREPTPPE